eukprot:GILI01010673.1.p1 GENE.GILI01010673.1~~GILI01010673.1.p1  ORF type:complete len:398 (-),score=115.23 GILI01010673.1:287-1480(-)
MTPSPLRQGGRGLSLAVLISFFVIFVLSANAQECFKCRNVLMKLSNDVKSKSPLFQNPNSTNIGAQLGMKSAAASAPTGSVSSSTNVHGDGLEKELVTAIKKSMYELGQDDTTLLSCFDFTLLCEMFDANNNKDGQIYEYCSDNARLTQETRRLYLSVFAKSLKQELQRPVFQPIAGAVCKDLPACDRYTCEYVEQLLMERRYEVYTKLLGQRAWDNSVSSAYAGPENDRHVESNDEKDKEYQEKIKRVNLAVIEWADNFFGGHDQDVQTVLKEHEKVPQALIDKANQAAASDSNNDGSRAPPSTMEMIHRAARQSQTIARNVNEFFIELDREEASPSLAAAASASSPSLSDVSSSSPSLSSASAEEEEGAAELETVLSSSVSASVLRRANKRRLYR